MSSESSWVTSAGGPLILIPQSFATTGAAPRAPTPMTKATSGAPARSTATWDSSMSEAHRRSSWVTCRPAPCSFTSNVLVREIAGDENDASLFALVADLLPRVEWESGPTWTVDEPVVLFDSVYESTEIATGEHLRIDLPKRAST